jgi:release factor glutamine methyltransferase
VTTIKEALEQGSRKLRESDHQNDRRAARILLSAALGVRQELILANYNDEITAVQHAHYIELISRHAHGEPLQHITGHQEFFGLDFFVTRDVLIPRPETEFLVQQILKLAAARGDSANSPLIADIGTGSGCIAVALAVHLPVSRIIATDISLQALDVARQNADTHGVANRIEFLLGDLFGPILNQGLEKKIDFVACNPPYVPASQPDLLQREVREFEPAAALYGGSDGLSFYRRLLVEALGYLKPGGYMVCELGFSQVDSVRAMVDPGRWELLDLVEDLQGIPRTMTLKKRLEG